MQLWCCILRQAKNQLNLLRRSRVDPSKLTFEVLYGKHDYDQNPWAPLGCAVELHVTQNKQKTWGKHTASGFYLGNATEHYRCHEIWTIDTRSVRIGQTIFFKHKYLTQPSVTESDALLRASDELCAALQDTGAPVKGDTQRAVDMLMDISKISPKRTNHQKTVGVVHTTTQPQHAVRGTRAKRTAIGYRQTDPRSEKPKLAMTTYGHRRALQSRTVEHKITPNTTNRISSKTNHCQHEIQYLRDDRNFLLLLTSPAVALQPDNVQDKDSR